MNDKRPNIVYQPYPKTNFWILGSTLFIQDRFNFVKWMNELENKSIL